jgi:hypothetical protein
MRFERTVIGGVEMVALLRPLFSKRRRAQHFGSRIQIKWMQVKLLFLSGKGAIARSRNESRSWIAFIS